MYIVYIVLEWIVTILAGVGALTLWYWVHCMFREDFHGVPKTNRINTPTLSMSKGGTLKQFHAVVAVSQSNGIGCESSVPWKLPADMVNLSRSYLDRFSSSR